MDRPGLQKKIHCCPKHDDPECDGAKETTRPPTDGDRDGFLEFFALMDKIQAMNNHFKRKRLDSNYEGEKSRAEDVGGNVTELKSPWKPSFLWEDFSDMPRKDRRFTERYFNSCINNSSDSLVSKKTDHLSDKYMLRRSFDLNEEAVPER